MAGVLEADPDVEVVGTVGVDDVPQFFHHLDARVQGEGQVDDGGAQARDGHGVEDEAGVDAEVAAGSAPAGPDKVGVQVQAAADAAGEIDWPDSVAADKAYSNRPCCEYLRRRGIRHTIREKTDSQAAPLRKG